MTEATTLRAKMEQKNQLLVSIQQETARLMKTHTRTLHEVRRIIIIIMSFCFFCLGGGEAKEY